jgi:hypothetical protein
MDNLALSIEIDGNRLVIKLVQYTDQGDIVIASDFIDKTTLKLWLDE